MWLYSRSFDPIVNHMVKYRRAVALVNRELAPHTEWKSVSASRRSSTGSVGTPAAKMAQCPGLVPGSHVHEGALQATPGLQLPPCHAPDEPRDRRPILAGPFLRAHS